MLLKKAGERVDADAIGTQEEFAKLDMWEGFHPDRDVLKDAKWDSIRESLSPEERAVLADWNSFGYGELKDASLGKFLNSGSKKKWELFQQTIAKFPVYQGRMLRTFTGPSDEMWRDAKVGDIFSVGGITAFTAEGRRYHSGSILVVNKGKATDYRVANSVEAEVLVKSGTRFKVLRSKLYEEKPSLYTRVVFAQQLE